MGIRIKFGTARCPNANLDWDTLIHAGTQEEKKIMNDLRLEYVKILKKKLNEICSSGICKPSDVGTSTNITAESDIDINLNTQNIEPKQIIDIYNEIYAFHKQYFAQDFVELFDINIYGSSYPCKSPLLEIVEKLHSQRYWAFARFVDCNQNYNTSIPEIQTILNETRTMLKAVPKQKYITGLKNYFKAKLDTNSETALSAFSLSKYYENDTYRSAGAFLHIVGGLKDMPAVLYMDSMIDNLGMALENLYKTNKCVDIPLVWKMLRVAKYLQRMVQALMFASIKGLKQIYDLCDTLNAMRKSENYIKKEVINKFAELLEKINVLKSKETTIDKESIKTRLIDFAFHYYVI